MASVCARVACRAVVAATVAGALFTATGTSWAGGFEFPDNGTTALGRGAAFTAKADDPSAVYYNVAGLARQRGTRILFNGNLSLHEYTFQREGVYPDDPNNPQTPWGGEPFPLVKNTGGPFFAPFAAVTTDFGVFDRLTFAFGAFGPSAIGNRTFPLGVEDRPSPARYDFIQSKSLLFYPTLAAAYRVLPWLDIGIGAHLVVASFDQVALSFSDLGRGTPESPGACPNEEYQPCDSRSRIEASATTATGSIGVHMRPEPWLAMGAQFRMPYGVTANGTVTATPPKIAPLEIEPGEASIQTSFPGVLRTGVRLISMDGAFEEGDVELNVSYETWGAAQSKGVTIRIPELGPSQNVETVQPGGYQDTFSIRLGGQWNFRDVGDGILHARAGTYFDSSATPAAWTRLNFDTLPKAAATLGVGYTWSGVTLGLSYAFVASLSRTVTDGMVRPTNSQEVLDGTTQVAPPGSNIGSDGAFMSAVNNGVFSGATSILSFGVTGVIDDVFFGGRTPAYGDDWELAPTAGATSRPSSGEEGAEAPSAGSPVPPKAASLPASKPAASKPTTSESVTPKAAVPAPKASPPKAAPPPAPPLRPTPAKPPSGKKTDWDD